MYGEFESRDLTVLAVSLEDRTYEMFHKILENLKIEPKFELLADLNYRTMGRYARTTAYFIDGDGIVRQIFPLETYTRASWWAVIAEIDRLRDARED